MKNLKRGSMAAVKPGLIFGLVIPPVFARDWIDAPVVSAAARMLSAMPDDYYTIRPAAARQEIAVAGQWLLDVREAAEYKTERIAAATNIPIRQLVMAIDTMPENKAAPILVYCRSGRRGAIALTVLRMAGYTNVRSLAGGMEAWKAAGFPVTQ
jgi:rhodanese-related sulfurtransferase